MLFEVYNFEGKSLVVIDAFVGRQFTRRRNRKEKISQE
jgi:hypothetical protein